VPFRFRILSGLATDPCRDWRPEGPEGWNPTAALRMQPTAEGTRSDQLPRRIDKRGRIAAGASGAP